jgi:hypothetical protein
MVQQARRVAAAVVAAVAIASNAQAISTSDRPTSILTWPKIVVDIAGRFNNAVPVDTLVTLANTDTANMTQAHCFYVNANSHCADNPARVCRTSADCVTTANVAECIPGWDETDFDINLTQEQPLNWYAQSGLQRGQFPLEGPFVCLGSNIACEDDAFCVSLGYAGGCDNKQSNLHSGIPPVAEDPFIGSLTCIQFNTGTDAPEARLDRDNMLIGDATILRGGITAPVDVSKYNAIGLGNIANDGNSTLGLNGVEYQACPATLILSHLFDGATDPLTASNATVQTSLTLMPCGNDFATQTPGRTTAQFLVFNEFEQRFSTSRTVDCLLNTNISSIDTRVPARSIFATGVAGTIGGQTRIRGVGNNSSTGNALIGVAEMRTSTGLTPPGTSGYNLHQQGSSSGDTIILP